MAPLPWRENLALVAGLVACVLAFSAISSQYSSVQLEAAGSEPTDNSLSKFSEEASKSLERAKENELAAKSLRDALSGANTDSQIQKSRKAVRQISAISHFAVSSDSSESTLEKEAQEAGAKSLEERDPVKPAVHTSRTRTPHVLQVARSSARTHMKASKLHAFSTLAAANVTVPNPLGYLHKDDPYVSTGSVLDRSSFVAQESSSPAAPGGSSAAPAGSSAASAASAAKPATSAKSGKAREEELADSSWIGSTANSKPTKEYVRNLNSPYAPVPEGGVPVPGGHIIWVPEQSLEHDESKAAQSRQPAHVAKASAPTASSPMAASAAPSAANIVLPLPLMTYSKVVAYGPDGKPELMWYRPGSQGEQQQAKFSGYADKPLSSGPNGRKYSVLTTGASNSEQRPAAERGERGRRAEAALSAEDKRIERDLLYRLLNRPEGEQPRMRVVAPGRVQELAESAASAAGGPTLLALAVGSLVALWGPLRWAR